MTKSAIFIAALQPEPFVFLELMKSPDLMIETINQILPRDRYPTVLLALCDNKNEAWDSSIIDWLLPKLNARNVFFNSFKAFSSKFKWS